jgi:hypothetical protein
MVHLLTFMVNTCSIFYLQLTSNYLFMSRVESFQKDWNVDNRSYAYENVNLMFNNDELNKMYSQSVNTTYFPAPSYTNNRLSMSLDNSINEGQSMNISNVPSGSSSMSSLTNGTRQAAKKVKFSTAGPLENNRQNKDVQHSNYYIPPDDYSKRQDRSQEVTSNNLYLISSTASFHVDTNRNIFALGDSHSPRNISELSSIQGSNNSMECSNEISSNCPKGVNSAAQMNYFSFTRPSQLDDSGSEKMKAFMKSSSQSSSIDKNTPLISSMKKGTKNAYVSEDSSRGLYCNDREIKPSFQTNGHPYYGPVGLNYSNKTAQEENIRSSHARGGPKYNSSGTTSNQSHSNKDTGESYFSKSLLLLNSVKKSKMYKFAEDSDCSVD